MNVWTIAAFAKTINEGNLAGVALVDEYPNDSIMQNIASRLNYSETAFIKRIDNGTKNTFSIRWFTPKYEVDLCGHATMAASFFLWQQQLVAENNIEFHGTSGVLRASHDAVNITLDFPLETTGPLEEDLSFNWEKALGGLKPIYIGAAFGVFKEYLVELSTAQEVINLVPDIHEINKLPGNGLIVTAHGDKPYDMVSRIFAPQDGIPEDPICISAHVKLAHFWQQRLGKSNLSAYQASQRGGEIQIAIRKDRVFLSGTAVMGEANEF